MNVAVFGASGVIGTALLPRLAREHRVVAVSRTARPSTPGIAGVRWMQGDVSSPGDVARAVEEADVVYYLVHSLGTEDFERKDREAAENVAKACEHAGVKQIIYLGGLGDHADDASPHLRSRHETGELLASGPVPVTTLRAAMIVGKGSAAFETTVSLVDRLPVMIMPRWVSTPTQPIAIDDISRYLAGVCGLDAAFGAGFDAGGPEVMTYRQIVERIAKLRGRQVVLVEVPILSPRLSSLWLHLVTPVNASVARPLVEGLRNPTVAREERIRKLLPFDLTPFDVVAEHTLSTEVGSA
jgi:uncharacterized protein YbjT (DUF2867 family)